MLNKKKSNYDELLSKIHIQPKIIFEVGIKDAKDTLILSKRFKNSKIYAYEANPLNYKLLDKKLKNIKNVYFEKYGLGEVEELKSFFVYAPKQKIDFELIGASSFYKRPDSENQIELKDCKIKTLENEFLSKKIKSIDVLLMDVQGFEINILKGAKERIRNISYIIMETPKPESTKVKNSIDSNLKINDYIGAPSFEEVFNFMKNNNFTLIDKIEENLWEDNSLFKYSP